MPLHPQIEREARYDVIVGAVILVLFFGCMLALPRDWFWFYFVPLAGFWYRYVWVRDARDDDLLRAEIAAGRGGSPAGCYAGEGGICISDGTHQVLVARQKPQALLQLPDIVRHK